MLRTLPTPPSDAPPSVVTPHLSIKQAHWTIGALRMMIEVVGAKTIVGMVLTKAKNELVSLLASAEMEATAKRSDDAEIVEMTSRRAA